MSTEIIEKIHSDLVVVDPVKLADMSVADLMALAKETNGRATTAAKQSLVHVGQTGVVLIELKNRLPHGTFMSEVKHRTGIDHRTVSNYMLIARHFGNVSNLRGVRDALRYIHDAVSMAKSGGNLSPPLAPVAPPPAPPTSPAPAPAPAPARSTVIEVDTEIVEPVAAPTAPPQIEVEATTSKFIPSDGLAIGATAKSVLDRLHANDTEREEALHAVIRYCEEKLPAPAVAVPTASPAPSLIEVSETTLATILALLKRLRPVEITELHRVIESRWLKPQNQTAAL